jgi:hypothetical protein
VRLDEDGVGLGLLGLGGLHLGGEFLALGQQSGPLVTGGLPDQLAELLLLATQGVGPADRGTTTFVRGQQPVDQRLVLATRTLGRAHRLRVFAHRLELDHGMSA